MHIQAPHPSLAVARSSGATRTEPTTRSAWRVRIGVAALLAGTSALYLVGLGRSGWANAYYSAAAQAGVSSWRAWFFGATDAPGSIMVDKPPAAVWLMGLSARLFGVNSWAILVPQALLGVVSVGLLYLTVRRWFGPVAGLVAGLLLALTPVAVLMFRFNNPDALLVSSLLASGYAVVRALDAEHASAVRQGRWWLVGAGAAVGLGFLTKSLQAFLVLPGLAAGYLVASPLPGWRRLARLLLGGLAILVSGGWWVAAVELWPADRRPYVGGSRHDSVIELIFGYNGFGRLTGQETGSAGGGYNSGSLTQLFDSQMASQVSWLLPAALAALLVLAVLAGRAARTDRLSAARLAATALIWGGWLLVTGAVFSLSRGVIHSYYTVALAPPIAVLVAVGGVELARRRARPVARLCLAALVAGTGAWAWLLLGQVPGWLPWLRTAVLVGSFVAAVAWLLAGGRGRALARTLAVVALVVGLAGPTAYSVQTAATAHTGALPTAGPPGMRGPNPAGRAHGPKPPGRGGPGGHGIMALLEGVTPPSGVTELFRASASGHTWVAATVGSEVAASYQLAAGAPVMAVGGFNGTDPSPTLAAFQALVRAGAVRWFVDSGVDASGAGSVRAPGSLPAADTGGSDAGRRITDWVHQHFTPRLVAGTTVWDLTAPA
jgi:4-amino-4-deoxy-L-arabinose transferase-like glycosyltransferase